ncbi:MAG: helix-turn-helix transcriptional regulator [Deltaproteobacteria bacterium]|nr:helix-turn-helix transcriptional regulator [Deltaproteobacteria bacterium]
MDTKVLTLGELIRTLRHRSKLSQTELARVVGVHFSSISRWERDVSTDEMKLKHIVKLASATNIPLPELLKASKHLGEHDLDEVIRAIDGEIDG